MEAAILFAVLIVFVAVCGTCHSIKVGLDGLIGAAIDVRNALYELNKIMDRQESAKVNVYGVSNPRETFDVLDREAKRRGIDAANKAKSFGSVNPPPNVRIYPGTNSDDLQ
jgi:hypothetical protein